MSACSSAIESKADDIGPWRTFKIRNPGGLGEHLDRMKHLFVMRRSADDPNRSNGVLPALDVES